MDENNIDTYYEIEDDNKPDDAEDSEPDDNITDEDIEGNVIESEDDMFADNTEGTTEDSINNFIEYINEHKDSSDENEDFSKYVYGGSVINNQSKDYDNQLSNTKDEIIQNLIPDTISACSLTADNPDTCISSDALNIIETMIETDITLSPEEILEEAKKKLNCTDERCVIESEEFRSRAGREMTQDELKRNFKVQGPIDDSLLSNFNIDSILQQWHQTKFPNFFPYNFNMVDFEDYGGSLATVDVMTLYNNNFRFAACVGNTDKISGKGIHWIALAIDMRYDPWTVEFFNSSGNAPQQSWIRWMVKTKARLEQIIDKYNINMEFPPEIVKCTGIRHQLSRTECGVYSLMYIWLRLNGVPCEYFKNNILDDKLMYEFRQHIFHDKHGKNDYGKTFDYSKFKNIAKWEPGVIKNRK